MHFFKVVLTAAVLLGSAAEAQQTVVEVEVEGYGTAIDSTAVRALEVQAATIGPAAIGLDQVESRVRQALGLSQEQEGRLQALREKLQQRLDDIQTLADVGSLTGQGARTQFRRALDEYRNAQKEVLSPEQERLIARTRRYVDKYQVQGDAPSRQSLVQRLNLSPEQQGAWRQILAQQQIAFKQLKAQGSQSTREMVRRFRQAHIQSFEDILTPEQLAQFWEFGTRPSYAEPDHSDSTGR